jgi:DNA-binding NtrC family response regulator
MTTNALIITDQDDVTAKISELLSRETIHVHTANNGRAGIQIAGTVPIHLLITGMVMPGMQGNEIIREIKAIDERTAVWVITEERNFNLDFVVQAMKLGADDYFVVFEELPLDKLHKSLQAFKEKIHLIEENQRLLRQVQSGEQRDTLLGNCEQIRLLMSLVQKVAPTDAPVLITGESGTGKEVVARTLWELSDRRDRPYVPLNCGAIPETLLESELYGHEKGAFTGAHSLKIGKLESARGGTVFLDEIGEMPLSLQVKLLRFLQEGEIQRVGGTRTIRLDVRVLSATSKDLDEEIAQGRFREDLYYRLNVIHLHLPPLRERGPDVQLLANFFLSQFTRKEKRPVSGFSQLALTRMQEYPWPGNIRELKHKIHRAVILAGGPVITAEDLGFVEAQHRLPLQEAKNQFELRFISDALITCGGNISRASQALGIARQQLQRYVKKHGINPGAYRIPKTEPWISMGEVRDSNAERRTSNVER